jgi:hypothetical protein
VLIRAKKTEAALVLFRRAQTSRPLIAWSANREKPEFSVLFLDSPMAGSTPMDYLAGRADYDRHFYCIIPAAVEETGLLRAKSDVVFNMISNADDGVDILPLACDLVDRLGHPTVNHPRSVMNTDRETLARILADIPGCNVSRTIRAAGTVLAEAASNMEFAGLRMPLPVRLAGTHGGDDFDKCENRNDIAAFVARRPEANYYLTEYADYRSDDGWFRKYRFIFIDGEIWPYHLAIHDDWKVHHFRTGMANHAWMRQEEERFLDDMGGNVRRGAPGRTRGDRAGDRPRLWRHRLRPRSRWPDRRVRGQRVDAGAPRARCGVCLQKPPCRADQGRIRCHVVQTPDRQLDRP